MSRDFYLPGDIFFSRFNIDGCLRPSCACSTKRKSKIINFVIPGTTSILTLPHHISPPAVFRKASSVPNLPAHFLFASPRGCLNPAEAPTASPAPSTEQPPALLLAKTWSDQDIEGWWMSEKLDGLRAYWNGRHLVCPTPREDVHRWICILAHPICVCGCGC